MASAKVASASGCEFNLHSREYSDFIGLDPIRGLHYRSLISHLGDLRGKNILDVGCGDGRFASILASAGAAVTGYDRSEKLIRTALDRDEAKTGRVSFQVATPESFKSGEEFDHAVSVLVLPYATDPCHLTAFFSSAFKHLRDKGNFISVILNPDFKNFGMAIGNRFWRRVGKKVEVQFLDRAGGRAVLTAKLSQFSKGEYERAAEKAGFAHLSWAGLSFQPEGEQPFGSEFWAPMKKHKPYSIVIAKK